MVANYIGTRKEGKDEQNQNYLLQQEINRSETDSLGKELWKQYSFPRGGNVRGKDIG